MSRPRFGFPKTARILRRNDFRRVYDKGNRFSCKYFAAFCLPDAELARSAVARSEVGCSAVGFTVSRAGGKAVIRNRMKRRMREAVRLHLSELPAGWLVVFNPRKPLLEAAFTDLEREVSRVFAQCGNS